MNRGLVLVLAVVGSSSVLAQASAHSLGAAGAGLGEGFLHPLSGLDHLLAMLAVGVWAAQEGGRALWAAPASFLAALLLGGTLAMAGVPLVAVETGILVSLLVIGSLIALSVPLPRAAAAALIALFGLVHGHAHGAELPAAAAPGLYAVGFVVASALLHLIGMAATIAARRFALSLVPRVGGGLVAAVGAIGLLLG